MLPLLAVAREGGDAVRRALLVNCHNLEPDRPVKPGDRRPDATKPGLASRMQDHLAHRLAAGQHFQRVGGLRQGEGAIDMR